MSEALAGKIIRTILLLEDESPDGITYTDLQDYCDTTRSKEFQKTLSFLLATDLIKRIGKKKGYYKYLVKNRTCPFVHKIIQGIRNDKALERRERLST